VGELVIIREYIDKKPSFRWRPAICRWLFGDDHQGTSAGLEFLDGTLIPCRLNNKLSKSKNAKGQVALLYKPASNRPHDPMALIATRGTYRDGRDFLLRHGNQVEDIKTRKRTLVTPCIEIFHYQSYDVIEVEKAEHEEDSDMIPWTSVPNYSDLEDEKEEQDINLDSIRLPGDH
jgi:hypothetical protein